MTRIPEETIEEIRTKTDIVDLIGEYIQLTKRGKNWFGLCPFHGESTPSFSVSEDKQLFHCFGCGASGNAITFVMDIENRSFTDAVAHLGNRSGIEIEASSTHNHTQGSTKHDAYKSVYEAYALAANFYNHLLMNTVEGEDALEYLQNRGFSREDIEKYGIGWSLPDNDALAKLLERQGYDLLEMEQAGLILMSDDGSHFFDRFRGRVMFPLYDDNGTVVAFSGRTLLQDKSVAKYVNSPETPIFEKSKILYNLHNARLNIRKTGKVILFEGFMDTISADRSGILNTVALMGTSLSDAHLVKLQRISKEILICCDGDDAGWEAAKRFALLAQKKNIQVQVAILPAGLDPDDYIQQFGADQFLEKVIDNPLPFMAFMMAYAKRSKNLSYENDVLQFIHEVLEQLAQRTSPVERDLYIRQLSEETNVSVEAIQQQFLKVTGNQAKQAETMPSTSTPIEEMNAGTENTATSRAERLLLCHLLHDVELFLKFQDARQEVFIADNYQVLSVHLAGFYEQYGVSDIHRFVETLESRELRALVLEAAMVERDDQHKEEEIKDCLTYLERYRIEMMIQDKKHASKEAEKMNNHTRALELARDIIQLRKTLEQSKDNPVL